MVYYNYAPPPPLADFVALIWYLEAAAPLHPRERLMPSGTVELIFNLKDDRIPGYEHSTSTRLTTFPGSIIVGAHSEFCVIDTSCQTAIMGIHFKPGGMFPFLKMPNDELHNQHIALENVWGRRAGQLRERLLEAPSLQARFRVVETALMEQLARPLERHPAVTFALNTFSRDSCVSVTDVSDQIGLNPRRFIDTFRAEVGVTPKLFLRVRRFQQVLHHLHRLNAVPGGVDWADIALSAGYYDQAHFIHDFRAFSGFSPTAYLTQHSSDHLNHVPLFD